MNTTLTAMIVEDEERPLAYLTDLLKRQHPEVSVIGTASDVQSAVGSIRRSSPDLLFLDVEIGDRTAFDLLQALGESRPQVIFTTAHESYAIKAIRFSALDYLLKPVDPDELKEAVGKVQRSNRAPERPAQMAMLLKNIDRSGSERTIAVPVSDGLEILYVNEILACESDSNYTMVHLRDGGRLVIARTMKQFEDLLGNGPFKRVHNRFLVNIRHVRRYIRGDGGELVLSNRMHVPVARRKKQELLDSLDLL